MAAVRCPCSDPARGGRTVVARRLAAAAISSRHEDTAGLSIGLATRRAAQRGRQPSRRAQQGADPRGAEARASRARARARDRERHRPARRRLRCARCPRSFGSRRDADPELRADHRGVASARRACRTCARRGLDVHDAAWPRRDAADAVVCINMIHIAPWAATQALLDGAARAARGRRAARAVRPLQARRRAYRGEQRGVRREPARARRRLGRARSRRGRGARAAAGFELARCRDAGEQFRRGVPPRLAVPDARARVSRPGSSSSGMTRSSSSRRCRPEAAADRRSLATTVAACRGGRRVARLFGSVADSSSPSAATAARDVTVQPTRDRRRAHRSRARAAARRRGSTGK